MFTATANLVSIHLQNSLEPVSKILKCLLWWRQLKHTWTCVAYWMPCQVRLLNWASTYNYTELPVVSQRKSRTSSSFIFTSILLEPKHLFPVLTNYVWFIMLLKNLLWSSGKCNIQWMETWQKRKEKCSQNGKRDTGNAWRALWGGKSHCKGSCCSEIASVRLSFWACLLSHQQ